MNYKSNKKIFGALENYGIDLSTVRLCVKIGSNGKSFAVEIQKSFLFIKYWKKVTEPATDMSLAVTWYNSKEAALNAFVEWLNRKYGNKYVVEYKHLCSIKIEEQLA